jgi:hypothetical protein
MTIPEGSELARRAWQSQLPPESCVSPEFVRAMASKLDIDVAWRLERNIINGAVFFLAALFLSASAVFFWGPHRLPFNYRLAFLLAIALMLGGTALIAWHIARYRGSPTRESAAGARTGLEVYRQELIRRRDYYTLSSKPWSIWPLLPAVVAFEIATLYDPVRRRAVALSLGVGIAVLVGTAVGIAIGRLYARGYQLELDALNALEQSMAKTT